MDSSTEKNSTPAEYEQGWIDALTEAMRLIGGYYIADFNDPFRTPSPAQPLIMVQQLADLRKNPPSRHPKPTRMKHAK